MSDWWCLFQVISEADPGIGHSLRCCLQQGPPEKPVPEGLVLSASLNSRGTIIPYCSNRSTTASISIHPLRRPRHMLQCCDLGITQVNARPHA